MAEKVTRSFFSTALSVSNSLADCRDFDFFREMLNIFCCQDEVSISTKAQLPSSIIDRKRYNTPDLSIKIVCQRIATPLDSYMSDRYQDMISRAEYAHGIVGGEFLS